jgi:UDP-glucose 4-epimerase
VPDIYGDHGKIARDAGWQPKLSIGDSLRSLWEWARTQA